MVSKSGKNLDGLLLNWGKEALRNHMLVMHSVFLYIRHECYIKFYKTQRKTSFMRKETVDIDILITSRNGDRKS